ncbi:serine protease [Micromonosporaceae bacterium B7E4]
MRRHAEPRPARVTGVFAYRPGSPDPDAGLDPAPDFGTGYRISDRLVLTAAHVLENLPPDGIGPDGGPALFVDLGGDGLERPATCVWRDPDGRDLALLRLADPPPGHVPPVRLGRIDLTRATTVSVLAMGYPRHTEIYLERTGEYWRGRSHINGRIHTASGGRPEALRLHPDVTVPEAAPGDSPWKGMSGAAVFAGSSHLLVGVFWEQLSGAGAGQQEITRLDAVTDQRWRDLLEAEDIDPDPRPVFPDGWNQTCPGLTPYGDHVDNLVAEDSFLTSGRLRFVDPGDHPSAPRHVLAALTRMVEGADRRLGVMLSGIPGVGKTRLCLETAALADGAGWLVVHLPRWDQRASLEDAWKCIEPLSSPVLLVVEDLEWLADTTAETVRQLRAGALNTGARLAILGPVRTAALDPDTTRWKLAPTKLFEEIEVRADPGYQADILRRTVRSLAEQAVQQAGEEHLMTICRGIPAIAVLLANYYNGEVAAGRDVSTAQPLGDQDIAGWLREVLDREELGLPSVRRSEPAARPDGRLTAAAWIAAATPLSAEALKAALGRRGEILSPLGIPWPPAELVDSLCGAGILARRGDTIQTVHHLYADRLLTEVLLKRRSGEIRADVLDQTLEPGLADQRVLCHVAEAVHRLREAIEDESGQALGAAVEQWCLDNAEELTALLDRDPDGRILHTLLRLPTWRPAARRLVEPIAETWLRRRFRDPKARDGVLSVASCLDPQVGYPYVIAWISHNVANPRAAYAFHKLSPPEGVDSAYGEWTVERAFKWLAQHAPHPNASFVLASLLDHGKQLGLPPGHPHGARLVAWALGWLRRNGYHRNAAFVARPLVQRPELTGADLEATASFLLDRVAPREPHNASFALEAVFRRHRLGRDLPDPVFKQAVKDSLRWLEDRRGYGRRPAAVYVLENLISPDLRGRDDLSRAVRLAWDWLDANGDVKEAGRLLERLLHLARRETDPWARLTEEESAELSRRTLSWLSAPEATRTNRISVLGALLRTRLIDDDADELRGRGGEALALCRRTPSPTVARDLLPPLLAKPALPADLRAELLDLTFDQLRRHPRDRHTSHPLTSLLRRPDLTAEEYSTAMAATLDWLGAHPFDDSAIPLLASALRNRRANRDDRGKLADRAVRILSRPLLLSRPGRELVGVLLAQRTETTPEWNRFVGRACGQVAADGMPGWAARVLGVLLSGVDVLDGPVRDELHATCIGWCAANPRSGQIFQLLPTVLGDRALSPSARLRAWQVGSARVDSDVSRVSGAGRLLAALLRDGGLGDATEADRVLAVALDWLEVRVDDGTAYELLPQVAHRLRQDAGAGRAAVEAVDRAGGQLDAWLDRHPAASPEQRASIEGHRDALARLAPG